MTNDIAPSGPVSTLPGTRHHLPDNSFCDLHPDRPAVAHVQGETDSFGCETYLYCAECVQRNKEEEIAARVGECDWCKKAATDLRDARDYDEGMAGPVYRICGDCQNRRDERIREELARYDDQYGDMDYEE